MYQISIRFKYIVKVIVLHLNLLNMQQIDFCFNLFFFSVWFVSASSHQTQSKNA